MPDVTCLHCRRLFAADPGLRGQPVQCPGCESWVVVPKKAVRVYDPATRWLLILIYVIGALFLIMLFAFWAFLKTGQPLF